MFSKIKNTETQPWWQDRTPKLFDLPCDQVQEHLDNLLSRVKTRLPELEKLLSQIHSYNAPEELGMYGIYHSSLKSLAKLQEITEKGSALIKEIGGEDYPPHPRYCQIVKEGTLPEFPFSHKRDRLQESLDPARLILSVLLTPSGSSHRFLEHRRVSLGVLTATNLGRPVGAREEVGNVSVREETSLEVVLSRGRRIGVRPGFDAGTLRELILVLEKA